MIVSATIAAALSFVPWLGAQSQTTKSPTSTTTPSTGQNAADHPSSGTFYEDGKDTATQNAAPASKASSASPKSADKPAFKQEELDQMLAPIALYPDSLLSQVLMASTYPLEVVQAERWSKANKSLKGDAAAKALEKEPWDPSVKSLVDFVPVLEMLSAKLDWTEKLGDAFISQQTQVMETVQKLRGKAKENGKLESTKDQKVEVKQEGEKEYIVIESTSPTVIYVPTYDPVVVYGTWAYPAYPPYPYYPPGYVAGGMFMSFAVGAAWGYAWGNCNWGHNDVDIDINRNTNINNNIDRSKYAKDGGTRGSGAGGGNSKWKHDPSHRGSVPYRNSAAAKQYGGTSAGQASQARSQYRGRAESGRAELNQGAADSFKGTGAQNRPTATDTGRGSDTGRGAGSGRTEAGGNRGASASNTGRTGSSSGSSRASSSTRSGGGLSGVKSGGSSARASSARGSASRGGGGRGGGGRR